jgi:hypothetical protein
MKGYKVVRMDIESTRIEGRSMVEHIEEAEVEAEDEEVDAGQGMALEEEQLEEQDVS